MGIKIGLWLINAFMTALSVFWIFFLWGSTWEFIGTAALAAFCGSIFADIVLHLLFSYLKKKL